MGGGLGQPIHDCVANVVALRRGKEDAKSKIHSKRVSGQWLVVSGMSWYEYMI
jgi:hypothetical protein